MTPTRAYIGPAMAAAFGLVLLAGCDRGARKDPPQDSQNLVEGDVTVYLQPDKFPNIVHRCDGDTGMWTTTQGNVWVVYADPACGAPLGERAPIVLDNIPGTGTAP